MIFQMCHVFLEKKMSHYEPQKDEDLQTTASVTCEVFLFNFDQI